MQITPETTHLGAMVRTTHKIYTGLAFAGCVAFATPFIALAALVHSNQKGHSK